MLFVKSEGERQVCQVKPIRSKGSRPLRRFVIGVHSCGAVRFTEWAAIPLVFKQIEYAIARGQHIYVDNPRGTSQHHNQ